MLFYESERSDQHNYLYCQRDHNFNFPAHLHHSFEFLCVQSGTLACTLETEQYEVHPGEALLVLPDQIHSYRTIGESQSVLWVFLPTGCQNLFLSWASGSLSPLCSAWKLRP